MDFADIFSLFLCFKNDVMNQDNTEKFVTKYLQRVTTPSTRLTLAH